MAKRYKIREEVRADGTSQFYIMSKEGWFGFWCYEKRWSDYANLRLKICKSNLKDAQAEVEYLKKIDADWEKSEQSRKIVKVKYHE